MQDLQAVLFDLDGVLVDSYEIWFRLMNAAARRFGAGEISEKRFRTTMWGQGVDADAACLGSGVEELEAFYNEHFMRFGDALAVDPAGRSVFDRIHAAGLRTAVVTNTPRPLARQILAVAGLDPAVLVGGTDVPRPKPAPDMVARSCQQLGVGPAETVMIGDSAFDRDAAGAAGVRFVGLRLDGDERIDRLQDLPTLLGISDPPRPGTGVAAKTDQ